LLLPLFANRKERESEQIMNLLSEEATNFKARSIALTSANWQMAIE
jgi:hypothetical protein